MPQRLKFGLYIANSGPAATPELIRDLADEAERRGFDGVWCNEHPIPAHEPDYEWPPGRPWKLVKWSYVPSYGVQTTLAYIAGRTKQVRLGCSVHPMPYYNPIMLAKSIATLDQLSDGRAILGTAVGWNRQEMEALGFHDFETRGAYTDESIELIQKLWTEKTPSFEGRWFNVRRGRLRAEADPEAAPADLDRRRVEADDPAGRQVRVRAGCSRTCRPTG